MGSSASVKYTGSTSFDGPALHKMRTKLSDDPGEREPENAAPTLHKIRSSVAGGVDGSEVEVESAIGVDQIKSVKLNSKSFGGSRSRDQGILSESFKQQLHGAGVSVREPGGAAIDMEEGRSRRRGSLQPGKASYLSASFREEIQQNLDAQAAQKQHVAATLAALRGDDAKGSKRLQLHAQSFGGRVSRHDRFKSSTDEPANILSPSFRRELKRQLSSTATALSAT